EEIKAGQLHPMEAKKRLGEEIVKLYHGEEKSQSARKYFDQKFSKRVTPDDLPEVKLEEEELSILDLLFEKLKFSDSKSAARRLIKGNAVKINDEKITDMNAIVKIESGMVVRAGKKKIVKIIK
ncbi:MAG: tyrosine--tRNA ligase, partial [Fusobacteriia bacterium 4572_132]